MVEVNQVSVCFLGGVEVTSRLYHRSQIQRRMLWFEPGPVAESVEHGPRVRQIVGLNPGQVESSYKMDTCRFLVMCCALLG